MRTLRWTGTGLCTLAGAIWLFIAIISAFDGPLGSEPESIVMFVLSVFSLLAVVVSWVRELAGSVCLIAVGVAHGVFAFFSAGHSRGWAVLISGCHS